MSIWKSFIFIVLFVFSFVQISTHRSYAQDATPSEATSDSSNSTTTTDTNSSTNSASVLDGVSNANSASSTSGIGDDNNTSESNSTTTTSSTDSTTGSDSEGDNDGDGDGIIKNFFDSIVDALNGDDESDTTEGLEPVEEAVITGEVDEVYTPVYVPPSNLPKINYLKSQKEIAVDPEASHSCQFADFTVDMSQKNVHIETLILNTDEESLGKRFELELQSVPYGFDIRIVDEPRSYDLRGGVPAVDITIIKNEGAQTGSFNVPLIFTKMSGDNSTSICQVNIKNSF